MESSGGADQTSKKEQKRNRWSDKTSRSLCPVVCVENFQSFSEAEEMELIGQNNTLRIIPSGRMPVVNFMNVDIIL